MIPYLDNSLRAQWAYHHDKDYMVERGQVVIVDEFTGRPMYGRRFAEGLHQAIEAKEGVEIQRENLTLATVTFQNYFRMYKKLAGMTGTAMTEADEFLEIYKLDVVAIPTHLPVNRTDFDDLVYMTEKAKFAAIAAEIKERHANHQPILIGTVAIETSERISKQLEKVGVPHKVLNAKQHEREAIIIAQAGRPGAVTIATNMAGRGVDILLGGNPEGLAREKLREQRIEITEATPEQWAAALKDAKKECAHDREIVLKAGGLFVLGTERHEARRIDNQLRGRSGRQGDPGESQFYLSLEDELMRKFGGDRVKGLMQTLKMPEDEPIRHNLISKSIQQAQTRVEGFNFDIRKRVLQYDDVVNKQRTAIYNLRQQYLTTEILRSQVEAMISEEIHLLIEEHIPDNREEWDPEELYRASLALYPVPTSINKEAWLDMDDEAIALQLTKGALEVYDGLEAKFTSNVVRIAERVILLEFTDQFWRRHLTDLDALREGIGLMAIAQRDPVVEYKREAFQMWEAMQVEIKQQVVRSIFRDDVMKQIQAQLSQIEAQIRAVQASQAQSAAQSQPQPVGAMVGAPAQPAVRGLAGQVRNVRAGLASTAGYAPTNGNEVTPNVAADDKPEPIKGDMWSKVGRNDPCPCGSGKKFKNCHYPQIRDQRNAPAGKR
jgi:preprotein translocase subunit SecA